MEQLWHLTCLEWRRTRGPVLGYFLLTLGLWGGVVFYFPVLRNGDMSADMILLTTSILTGILAYRSFAGDFGAGRLEFLFASGASPHALFLSRLLVALLGSALFGGAFALVEYTRIQLTPPDLDFNSGPIYEAFRTVRESIYLYVLPVLGLLLFASAVTSRGLRLLATALVICGACYWLDSSAEARSLTQDRVSFLESAWSVALVPFFIALSAAAVWARRHESERTNVKVLFVAAAVLVLGSRHITLETQVRSLDDRQKPIAIALSPARRQFAIETESLWRPSEFEVWSAGILDQSSVDRVEAARRHVFVGSIEGSLWCASPNPMHLDTSSDSPPWMNEGVLRVRGSFDDDDQSARARPLILDAKTKRLTEAPTLWRSVNGPREHAGVFPITVNPVDSDTELLKLANGASLWTLPTGEIELRGRSGGRQALRLLPYVTGETEPVND